MLSANNFIRIGTKHRRPLRLFSIVCFTFTLAACALPHPPAGVSSQATLTPATPSGLDLKDLPPPLHKIAVAVYGFRDETGQYKPSPESAFSTAVTQGAASMLIKALKDSGWYIPVEREGLQSLLTERRVLRAVAESEAKKGQHTIGVDNLLPATVIMQGGIIGYDSNIRTGGIGAKYLGIGMSTKYSVDQVTVNLRAVSVQTGEILDSVSTTKTIYSYEVHPSYFKFVNQYDLLEAEAGYTSNEPAQLAVKEAIDSAVIHLTVEGLKSKQWRLKNPADLNSHIIQTYMNSENYTAKATRLPAPAVGSKTSDSESHNWNFASDTD